MKSRGFFGIGCLNMKTHYNYGTLFRTALIMEADMDAINKVEKFGTSGDYNHLLKTLITFQT